jgi:hypothetical protein
VHYAELPLIQEVAKEISLGGKKATPRINRGVAFLGAGVDGEGRFPPGVAAC